MKDYFLLLIILLVSYVIIVLTVTVIKYIKFCIEERNSWIDINDYLPSGNNEFACTYDENEQFLVRMKDVKGNYYYDVARFVDIYGFGFFANGMRIDNVESWKTIK